MGGGATTRNCLLDALPPESVERLQPHLEVFALVVAEPVDPSEYAYFPVSGMISVVASMRDGGCIEIGMVGREGMYSVSALLSSEEPTQSAMVQLSGRALRLKRSLLRQEMRADESLETLMLCYVQATLSTITQSAACNRLHLLEQRCARWLLASHDRADADTFPMTHELLAILLGVRRASVTIAVQRLKRRKLIAYSHGTMTIVDRQGLKAVACECYRVIRNEFSRLIPALKADCRTR